MTRGLGFIALPILLLQTEANEFCSLSVAHADSKVLLDFGDDPSSPPTDGGTD